MKTKNEKLFVLGTRTLTTIALYFILAIGISNAQTITGKIIDSENNEPVIGASIVLSGTNYGTTSSQDGSFSMKAKAGKGTIQISFIGYKTVSIETELTEDRNKNLGNVEIKTDALGLSEVVVLGTRRSSRTVVKSAVPIDVIGKKEVQLTGSVQTVEILQSLIPSYTAQKNSIADATDYIRPAQLRGLGPEHVLVLINGKRRHISSVVNDNEQARGSVNVDMNSIPSASIERIEVLRDGAAAQYGSDAIAGVINIILKKSTDLNVSLNVGQYYSNERRGYKADEGLSPKDESSYYTNNDFNKGIYLKNWVDTTFDKLHTDGQSITLSASKGFKIGKKGFINASLQYWKQGKSSRAGLDAEYQYWGTLPNGNPTFTNSQLDLPTTQLSPKEATFNRENWWYGKSEMEDISSFLNFELPIKENTTIYSFAGLSSRNGSGPCFWRQPGSANTVRAIFPDGYLPEVQPKILDLSGSAGIKGTIHKVNYDLSETFGYNDFHFKGKTLNVSLGDYGDITNDPELTARTQFDGGGTKFSQATTNLALSKEVAVGLATPLNVAVGGEFRYEQYEIYKGERASYEDGKVRINDGPYVNKVAVVGTQCVQCFNNRDAVLKSRSNVAAYIDLETDIVEGLTLGTAGRFENYSDFGSTINGKISSRYELIKPLAIRAAISTGFRAPALAQQYYSNRSLQTATNGDLQQTGTFPVESDIAKALGAKPLKAENSMNYSAGITLNIRNFSITADAYLIDLKNRIILSELFANRTTDTDFSNYVNTLAPGEGISQINYFTNGLNTRTKGIDFVGRDLFVLNRVSNISLTISANVTETKITNSKEIETPDALKSYTNVPLLGHGNQVRIENSAPKTVINGLINYKWNNLNIMFKTVYYGKITVAERFFSDDPYTDQTYKGKVINDAEVSYGFLKDEVRFALGSNNIFDIYPDKRYKRTSRSGIFPYSGYLPYGFMGRYVYARITFNLK